MSRSSREPTRRQFLSVGLVGAGTVAGLPILTSCGSDDSGPDRPDPLGPLAVRARQDVADAEAVAAGYPDLAGPAGAVVTDRRTHAEALEAEIRRAAGDDEDPAVPPPAPQGTPPAADLGAARNGLANALRIAEAEAGELILAVPGHRAALLASVAACCASHQAVLT